MLGFVATAWPPTSKAAQSGEDLATWWDPDQIRTQPLYDRTLCDTPFSYSVHGSCQQWVWMASLWVQILPAAQVSLCLSVSNFVWRPPPSRTLEYPCGPTTHTSLGSHCSRRPPNTTSSKTGRPNAATPPPPHSPETMGWLSTPSSAVIAFSHDHPWIWFMNQSWKQPPSLPSPPHLPPTLHRPTAQSPSLARCSRLADSTNWGLCQLQAHVLLSL